MDRNEVLFTEQYAATQSLKNDWTRLASTYGCIMVMLNIAKQIRVLIFFVTFSIVVRLMGSTFSSIWGKIRFSMFQLREPFFDTFCLISIQFEGIQWGN